MLPGHLLLLLVQYFAIGRQELSVIVKRPDGYHVVSESGKNLGGPYKSMAEAKKRLQQVEVFKHMKAGK